ncbi:phospholipase A2 inhibitor and Ly6/PLAUR domain-containing protein [Esox lucius]|uniref:phospholipase A2 inhibitor and Ly6/PLAUR domain-containing protein n=1 Tax=Esox lucius TaxID=8010 RepID=UPI000576033C|nr:phospholipase A2 inhibitor and Ly6/PLAUR domain-containing protein [Esox lucius]
MMRFILTIAFMLPLLYTADTLQCYTCELGDKSCSVTTLQNCTGGMCSSLTKVNGPSDSITVSKKCVYVPESCYLMGQVNTLSVNNGYSKVSQSSFCCDTTGCNKDTLPALSDKANQLRCYTRINGSREILQCVGVEDHCFKYDAPASHGGKVVVYQGCASSDSCSWSEKPPQINLNCCKGNLCNNALGLGLSSPSLLLGLLIISLF